MTEKLNRTSRYEPERPRRDVANRILFATGEVLNAVQHPPEPQPELRQAEEDDDRRHHDGQNDDLPEKRYPPIRRFRGADGRTYQVRWPDDIPGPEQDLSARHRRGGSKKKR